MLVRIAKVNIPPPFGVDSFSENLHYSSADVFIGWSVHEVSLGYMQRSTDTQHPLQTLVSHPGKFTSHLPPIHACLAAYTTRVLLKIITGTYTNADILLIWKMEDKTPSLVVSVTHWIHVWIKMDLQKTRYFIKSSIKMILDTCIRLLEV